MEREKIVALILEDLKHNQLLNGLDSIGFTDNNRYTLSIDTIVADMMGYSKGKIPDKWLSLYQSAMLDIPHSLSEKEAHSRAITLFDSLSTLEE